MNTDMQSTESSTETKTPGNKDFTERSTKYLGEALLEAIIKN